MKKKGSRQRQLSVEQNSLTYTFRPSVPGKKECSCAVGRFPFSGEDRQLRGDADEEEWPLSISHIACAVLRPADHMRTALGAGQRGCLWTQQLPQGWTPRPCQVSTEGALPKSNFSRKGVTGMTAIKKAGDRGDSYVVRQIHIALKLRLWFMEPFHLDMHYKIHPWPFFFPHYIHLQTFNIQAITASGNINSQMALVIHNSQAI